MFNIGAIKWPGITKLVEECGELLQACGKLMGARGAEFHWDGTNLRQAISNEIADVLAACEFVVAHCNLDWHEIQDRKEKKLARYHGWQINADANQKALEP